MAFTSLAFMIFAPLFFMTYYLIEARHRALWVGLASLFFYAYWDLRYVPLLLVSALVDYYCSLRIHENPSVRTRRFWLITSLVLNLSILFFFKYWNFFAGNVEGATGLYLFTTQLALPLGISFYTLQTLSYTFDVYRGKIAPERNFGRYFLYVSFFPQLVAGPIERAGTLMPQLRELRLPKREDIHSGAMLIAWGLFAKLVVANNLAGFVAQSYFETDGGLMLWPISFLAASQVYCDFAGYTLIARGLAALMGVRLSLNFRQPFFAKNLISFWQRWHMSLTRWVMDYVHLPLARRFPQEPMRSSLVIMAMALIGFWHGASWNFIIFGVFNGVAMRLWFPVETAVAGSKASPAIRDFVSRSALLCVICIAAPMFFINDTAKLFSQLASMFSLDPGLGILAQAGNKDALLIGMAGLAVVLFNDWRAVNGSGTDVEALAAHRTWRKPIFAGLLAAIIMLGNFNITGFIYFAF
jgi:D-alanyl-lipoteichoic acid acyltransferase DltB (MBOAT superfamily)